ncbi:MAG: TlpA family protein disulfide reductase [Gammaproteobacteria bacterium]
MTVKTHPWISILLFLFGITLICSTARPVAANASLHAFAVGSLGKIQANYAGKPFLLVLWSLDCPPCRKELTLLGAVKKRHLDFHLVLVSTDSSELSEQIASVLAKHHLAATDASIFSETSAERLRYAIDPSWYGEMPRSYFYDPEHNRVGVSGALKAELIDSWLASFRVATPRKTGE